LIIFRTISEQITLGCSLAQYLPWPLLLLRNLWDSLNRTLPYSAVSSVCDPRLRPFEACASCLSLRPA
jgi:hypothetical protein